MMWYFPIKRTVLLAASLFVLTTNHECDAQIIFSEPFNEAANSTTGADNVGGVLWSTNCGGCVPTGDYYKVVGNSLQCDDTNGWADWVTGNINVALCTGGLNISCDISTANATNTFEECTCGCNCVDLIDVAYSLNGGGFVSLSGGQGGACGQTCAGGTYALIGAISPGTSFNFSSCVPAGNTLVLRISTQTWAQGEIYNVDNVTVSCSTCALPIELLGFSAAYSNGMVELNWSTATEKNNTYFTVQRSTDALNFEDVKTIKASGNSSSLKLYKAFDQFLPITNVIYYRLKQTDNDGASNYSSVETIEVKNTSKTEYRIWPNPSENGIFNLSATRNFDSGPNTHVVVADYTGRKVIEFEMTTALETIDLSAFTKGLYVVTINNGYSAANFKIERR